MAKILIADDDLDIAELLKFTLESENYEVVVANDGEEALRKTIEQMPDLVILDVNMPRLSGFEVCEKIRENSATCLIPVIILTSLDKIKDRITGIKLGADEYLTKPFEPLELTARVERLLMRTRESIAANPLTGLPGNVTIETEIRRRLQERVPFVVIYADLDNFKVFNDKYGFERGDKIIRLTAVILRGAISEAGGREDFLGNIGGDDFVVITTRDRIQPLTDRVMNNFDSLIPSYYDEDIRSQGYLLGFDRQGREGKFPIMSISLGAVIVDPGKYGHYSQIAEKAKDCLKLAKQQAGRSTLVIG